MNDDDKQLVLSLVLDYLVRNPDFYSVYIKQYYQERACWPIARSYYRPTYRRTRVTGYRRRKPDCKRLLENLRLTCKLQDLATET